MEATKAGPDNRGGNGASGPNDYLDGLKFGKKIYFEDVGGSQPPAPVSAASASGTKKGRAQAVQPQSSQQQQQVPRCQVEGCGEDLSGEKSYYCRHKVCAAHSKSPKVVVGGLEQRFCQQCSRFHELPEFDQGKRSCRRRLAGHNERRRKPPPGALSSRYDQQLPSSFHENGGRFGGFLMDFTRPTLPATVKDMWPNVRSSGHAMAHGQWPAAPDRPSSSGSVMAQAVQHYGQGSTSGTMFSEPELLPADRLGILDSNRALSLLSSKPWGTTGVSSLSPFESSTVTQQPAAASFMGNPWGLNRNEVGSSNRMQEVPHGVGVGLGQVIEPHGGGHFAEEQHLALQSESSDRQCMERVQTRTYDPSSNVMHWPL